MTTKIYLVSFRFGNYIVGYVYRGLLFGHSVKLVSFIWHFTLCKKSSDKANRYHASMLPKIIQAGLIPQKYGYQTVIICST